MSVPDALPPSPPSTSSRRRPSIPKALMNITSTPGSPASFPGFSNTRRKRVEFSPWTNAHEPLSSSQPPSSLERTTPVPPFSGRGSIPKSILKPVQIDENALQAPDGQQDEERSMGEMMESIVQQLSQDDRSISVDAYQTLSSVIREYDDIPEEAILKNKINTILKYIKRDLLRQLKPGEPQIADTNLITQALKVLVVFVWNRDYVALFSDEHRTFILDRSIQVIAEHSAPKSVIIHYLHLLATQDFRPGLITSNNRAIRLLEALKTLTEHIKGNGAMSERLLVYQRLLDQARPTMRTKANLWVEELLTGMTSSQKDVRTKAMMLGMKSCSAFLASSSMSVAVKSVLGKELETGKTFSFAMCRRLEKMILTREEAVQVPQIWAIVLLLSNAADVRLDSWPELKDWLKVIQRCFNCSESTVRQQANMAWNRFVYVVRPHDASETLVAMLSKPLTAQLEKQGSEKGPKGTRATAVSSYCNLLHYAFRPAATHKQYTRVWNEYIVKVMRSSFFDKNAANSDLASRVMIALLWNANKGARVWNENRALENTPIEPEELPTIDSKWIRAKSEAILDMFRVLLKYSSWGASGQSDRAYIAVAWTHFLKALREACSKEIKPSSETRQASTNVLNLLANLWQDNCQEPNDMLEQEHSLSTAQIQQMTRSAISELGTGTILTSLEYQSTTNRKTFILVEIFHSIIFELKSANDPDDLRFQISRNALQTSLSHYEKCLELLSSSLVFELQHETAHGLRAAIEATQIVERVLKLVPQAQVIRTLALLKEPLVMLLEDGLHLWNGQDDSVYSASYQAFIKTAINMLTKVPAEAVRELDDIFAAPFQSTHSYVVNKAVDMWNNHASRHDPVNAGPRLLEALHRFGNFMDPDLPGPLEVSELPANRAISPPVVIEEAVTPTSRKPSLSPGKSDQRGLPSPLLGSQYLYDALGGEYDITPPSAEMPVSRPRSRHDDSQVHFVPIESPPLPQREQDSQLLTAHQKEVRDRQRSEPAVVFPDLRSTPRPHSKSQSQGDCEFARKAAALVERPSTPTLPHNHDHGEPEIMASPTPRARHITNQIMDIEVPSSPPSMLDNQGKEGLEEEVMSSPPRGAAEIAQIGLDYAIPQPKADSEEVAVQLNDPLTEEIQQHTPEDVSEEKELGVQTHVGKARPETIQHLEVSEDPKPEEYLPSTVEETILSRNTPEENGDSSPALRPTTDSDEIDILSASQLSQDLDRHLSEAIETAELRDPVEDRVVSPPGEQEDSDLPKSQSQRCRKRKPSSLKFTTSKRRRSQPSCPSSSCSVEPENSVYSIAKGELLDCIEVAPSQAVQAIIVKDVAGESRSTSVEPPITPKRRRGRRRRTGYRPQSQEDNHTKIEVVVPLTASQVVDFEEEMTVKDGDVNVMLQKELDGAPADHGQDIEMEHMMDAEVTDVVEETSLAERDPANPEAAVPAIGEDDQPGIISALQGILERLKSTNPGDVDLRAVDELCFHIRFQAQIVAQQQAR